MADHHHAPVEINHNELERAAHMWGAYTKIGKWSVIAISVTLLLMAFIFIG